MKPARRFAAITVLALFAVGLARAEPQAEQEFDAVLASIDAALAKGDVVQAAQIATGAADSDALKPLASKAAALARVGKLLPKIETIRKAPLAAIFENRVGQVVTVDTTKGPQTGRVKEVTADAIILEKTAMLDGEMKRIEIPVRIADLSEKMLAEYKIQWTPKTPDEAVAAAMVAFAARNTPVMEAALQHARGHELYEHYDDLLVKLGGREPDVDESLIVHYDFEKLENNSVADVSGHDVNASATAGSPVLVDGVMGKAISFGGKTGGSGYLKAVSNPTRGLKQMSVSLWFLTENPGANYKLASTAIWKGGPGSGWTVGTHYPEIWGNDWKGVRDAGPDERTVPFKPGEWNHLAVVYDGSSVREYVNGQLARTYPTTGEPVGDGGDFTVGTWVQGFHFDGAMDDFRVYNRALSESEVTALYRQGDRLLIR